MNEEVYTVTSLNQKVKDVIDREYSLSNITLKGEVSNLKYHTNGHLYFSLKDDQSKINAVMFNYKSSLNFDVKDGMMVEVKGKVNVYVFGGTYQITVSYMKEDGIGNLYILLEELKKKLANEGLFDESRKMPLPRIPQKIGVITAPTGAAVRDIISTINRRFPLAEITLFPSLVQGEGAKENICKMLEEAYKSDVDVIILGRGGGSIEDLWAFNEEVVARKISERNKPVVSAVGHEIDFTISDLVSDLRAPTPTAAAELVVPSQIEIIKYLTEYKGRIISVIKGKLDNNIKALDRIKNSKIILNPTSMYELYMQKLDSLTDKLKAILPNKIETEKKNFDLINERFNNIINRYIEKRFNNLKEMEIKLELLNPDNILDKGYSLTLVNGKVVKSVKDIKIGDTITTKLKDGKLISNIMEVS